MEQKSRAPIRIIPQGEIAGGLKEPPAFRLADASSVFADRAARFEVLAAAEKGDASFLRFMGRIATAQQQALACHSEVPAPASIHLERCRTHGLPPLGIDEVIDPSWRNALRAILQTLSVNAPEPVRRVLDKLNQLDDAELDGQASRLLSLDYPALDPATVPFLGAALQVHWVKRATGLGAEAFRKLDVPTVCPVCGSPPVCSVQRIDVPVPGTRYLHCLLCATNWYVTRGVCSQCETPGKLAYYHIDNERDAVRGEACDECRGYVKSLNHEKDPQADPVADDLATLALDILLDESGYQRASPNYFFVPGQG